MQQTDCTSYTKNAVACSYRLLMQGTVVAVMHAYWAYITLHYMLHSKEEWEPHSGANKRLILYPALPAAEGSKLLAQYGIC
jgi:hypothetical protein